MVGRGGLIQARVLKLKKAVKGDSNAREVSDALPFLGMAISRFQFFCSKCGNVKFYSAFVGALPVN